MTSKTLILGGGMTGLAAGYASGLPVLEAIAVPGGICSSYYVTPHSQERLAHLPASEEAYHFEVGGGHWIFGGDPTVLHFIRQLTPLKSYQRRSSVYFRELDCYVPYPLQNHLRYLSKDIAIQAIAEMTQPNGPITTMADWLHQNFGHTLSDLFFDPFHERYTAGLYTKIAPQDAYKTPVDLTQVVQGALSDVPPVGYNTRFVYPQNGLNVLAQNMATRCNVRYGQQVCEIDLNARRLHCADGSVHSYDHLLSTLPLNVVMGMSGLTTATPPDPFTSVLVLNIGAKRGPKCPDDHWLYNPDPQNPFHRVGFYSNVDASFLPKSARASGDRVSIYVERAFVGGQKPSPSAMRDYGDAVVRELQDWQFIEDVEVLDPTWIDVAYTWSNPTSQWRQRSLQLLEDHGIYQIGRYGRWFFQGIADSIRDGFFAGSSFRP